MGRQNKRRQKKAKDRERRVRKNRKSLSFRRSLKETAARVRAFAPLPEFRIKDQDSDDDIRALVTKGIEGLNSHYPTLLSDDAIALMHKHVRGGWTDLVNTLAADITDMTRDQIELGLQQTFEMELGEGILRYAPENLVRRSLPMSCFTLHPGEHHWDVRCRSLSSRRSTYGALFQSPHRPSVNLDGQDLEVVFTRHCLNQLSDRIIPGWNKLYIGQAYVFGFLYECVYFEVVPLLNKEPALVVYNSCLRAGKNLSDYMQKLLRLKDEKDLSNYYYRVGYCPISANGDMAVAKTFLTPGYRATPERKTLECRGGKRQLADIEHACDDGINILSVMTDARTKLAVQWFHEHGVSQVKRLEREVFRDMAGPYAFHRPYAIGAA